MESSGNLQKRLKCSGVSKGELLEYICNATNQPLKNLPELDIEISPMASVYDVVLDELKQEQEIVPTFEVRSDENFKKRTLLCKSSKSEKEGIQI